MLSHILLGFILRLWALGQGYRGTQKWATANWKFITWHDSLYPQMTSKNSRFCLVLVCKLLGFLGQPPNHKLHMASFESGSQFSISIIPTKICTRQIRFCWHCKPLELKNKTDVYEIVQGNQNNLRPENLLEVQIWNPCFLQVARMLAETHDKISSMSVAPPASVANRPRSTKSRMPQFEGKCWGTLKRRDILFD